MKHLILVFAVVIAATEFSSKVRADQDSYELPAVQVLSSTLDTGCTFTARASRFTRKLTGLLVKEVRPGSVAAIAGVRAGDRVVIWNGFDLRGKDPAFIYTIRVEAKDRMITLPLGIVRRGRRQPEKVTLIYKDADAVLTFVRDATERPNQSPEPTVMLVTPRADARVAPSTTVAHL